jgi:hypothetical protein
MAAEVRYRSPFAVIIWWLWALFALANLIDLAVQGRNRFSLEAAAGLLVLTGVAYVTALRPRIVAGQAGLTVINPLRVHRIDWLSVTAVNVAELVKIRCAWDRPDQDGHAGAGERVIYAWAVHASRRRQAATRMRAGRRAARGLGTGGGPFGGGPAGGQFPAGSPGWRASAGTPSGAPAGLSVDADHVVAELTKRAEQARSAGPAGSAVPPESRWHWPSAVAVAAPALALIVVALVLGTPPGWDAVTAQPDVPTVTPARRVAGDWCHPLGQETACLGFREAE